MEMTLKIVRVAWVALSVIALIVAQVYFTGEQSSEVSGNLIFFMLIVSVPSSVVGYFLMFIVVSLFESHGLFVYNSRIVLSLAWGVYFLCGLIQCYLLPRALSALGFFGKKKRGQASS